MTDKRLQGYRALVTGASSGIGRALARALAQRGADLVITARRQNRLEELAGELREELGVEVEIVPLDLAQPDAALKLYQSTEESGMAVDILVNSAGFGTFQSFLDISWEQHAALLQVNIATLTHLTRLFVPKMIVRGRGYVMNIASIGAYTPTPDFAVYSASKVYVRNFTEVLDYELKGTGVRAISICPGGTRTEFMQTAQQALKPGGRWLIMPPQQCAEIAVRKMLGGRRNVVIGWFNALGVWLLRLVPRMCMPRVAQIAVGTTVTKIPKGALPVEEKEASKKELPTSVADEEESSPLPQPPSILPPPPSLDDLDRDE